jgi:hypothetical protein
MLGALLLIHGGARAQSYTLEYEAGEWLELRNAGLITDTWTAGGQYLVDLGARTFKFFGEEVDFGKQTSAAAVFADGEIILVSDTLQFTLPVFLAALRSRDIHSSITQAILPYNGDTAYIVQWKNAGFTLGDEGNYVNFQIWIYQSSGIIEYRYGDSRVIGTEPFGSNSGPPAGIMASDRGIKSWYTSVFAVGPATNPRLGMDSFFTAIDGVPPSGTVYRFRPTSVAAVTGKKERSEAGGLRIFPNPAGNVVTVANGDKPWPAGSTATVRDLLGRVVATSTLGDGASTVDLSSLPSGTYLITVEGKGGRRTATVVKE